MIASALSYSFEFMPRTLNTYYAYLIPIKMQKTKSHRKYESNVYLEEINFESYLHNQKLEQRLLFEIRSFEFENFILDFIGEK